MLCALSDSFCLLINLKLSTNENSVPGPMNVPASAWKKSLHYYAKNQLKPTQFVLISIREPSISGV